MKSSVARSSAHACCGTLGVAVVRTMVKPFAMAAIRAISLDVTGTLVYHRQSIAHTYADAAAWAQLEDPPSAAELKPAFKAAYKAACLDMPCFGFAGASEKAWWASTVRAALANCGRHPSDADFERYFRRIYQHFGSSRGYEVLPDAKPALEALSARGLTLGITSNTPSRTVDTTLPMLGLDDAFKFYACAHECGHEKPDPGIFQVALDAARFWCPDLQPHEVLHVGDSLACDFVGARAFGFQALYLDRSGDDRVTVYNTWTEAGDYPGKSEEDLRRHTITDLEDIVKFLDGDRPKS